MSSESRKESSPAYGCFDVLYESGAKHMSMFYILCFHVYLGVGSPYHEGHYLHAFLIQILIFFSVKPSATLSPTIMEVITLH